MWEYTLNHPTPGVKIKHKKPGPRDRLHPVKYEFIVAKYKYLTFIPRLTRDKDSRNAAEDLSKQLHACARTNNLETCLRLIAHGANPNYLHPERGSTPLHVAALAGESMQVELLIVHGADPCMLDRLGHTPDECARIAGHHQLADRIIECQYDVTDCLSHFLFGRKPAHAQGEHFLFPSSLSVTKNGVDGSITRTRLSELDNAALEDLAADLYDEIDRRETDAMWLTNQQLESLVAFLPVNPLFSPLRNQARQKLAMLDKGQFSQILVDVLNECLYRQKRSMETGDCDNGRPIPSGSSDAEMMAPSHDYDEVPLEEMEMEESEETPSESKDKSKEEQSTDGSAKRASKEAEEETEALKQKLKKTESMMEHLQKVNKALTNQVKELSHEVEKLKHENVTILKQQESSFIGAKKRAHSLPPSEVPFIKERVKHDSPIMEGNGSSTAIDPYMTVNAARQEVKNAMTVSASEPSYSVVNKVPMRKNPGRSSWEGPTLKDIDLKIGTLTKRIQELLEAAQMQKTSRFSFCCERVSQSVKELAGLFMEQPKSTHMKQALDGLIAASQRLSDDHASNKTKGDMPFLVQQVVTSAYDVAKAAKFLMTTAESIYKK